MRKVLSRKNLGDTSQHGPSGDTSQHGTAGTSSLRHSLSSAKLSKSFSRSFGDHAWSQDLYPIDVNEYELQHVIGKGASATVWLAECIPLHTQVAIKLMDLENFGANLDIVMQEAMIMRQQRHENVLPLLAAFLSEAVLWMVMPYVAGGSIIHILNKKCPGGYEEPVIATVGRAVLSGLNYMHPRGFIHRDIKGENVLVDEEGHVMLADFGVTAAMEPRPTQGPGGQQSGSPAYGTSNPSTESGSALQRMDSERSCHCYLERHTFVGTPCFMAPEVMEQEGYYQAADIWAFGILLMELATGHAPYANFSLTNIIIMTMHSPVPELERTFSDALRDVVAQCLNKDPEARPSASDLLKHKFFKLAKDPAYIREALLADAGGSAALMHSSSNNFTGNSRKTVGRGMRSMTSKKSMQYNAMHAVMSSNASDARKVLKKVTKGTWTNKGCTIDPCVIAGAAGVAFTTLRRMEGSTQGFGNGFVLARMEHENGNIAWSAPSYFDLMVPGAGAEFSKVELCFVVPDDATLNLFTKGTNSSLELPRARDVELGLASRSDLINILNHTLHGGKSVLGVGGPDGQADNAGILNKALFGTHGSDVNLQGSDENPSFHFGSQNTPGDSPGGLFRMDLVNETPPSSRRELERGPSMLFPVTLSANPPPESIDPNLETRASSTSGGSNSMFSVNDTAMDDNPGVLRAPPPPSRPLSPTPLFQHAQQDPNGRPLQSSPLLFHQSEAGPPQGLDANPNPPSLFPIPQQGKQQLPQQGLFPMPQQAQGPQPGQLQGSDSRPSSPPVYQQGQQQVPQQGLFPLPQQGQPQVPPAEQPRQDDMSTQQQLQQQPSLRHQLPRPPSSSALSRQGSLQGLDVEQPPGLPQSAPPPRRMKLYAYGIADPEYMSLPCKMSMKHARVTVNHETNNRLYGKKLPGQILGGQVEAPVEFLPLYDVLATVQNQCAMKTEKEAKSETHGSVSSESAAKPKGMFKKLFSKKG